MKRFPFRPVLAGILFGTALFFAPFFLLRAFLFVFIIGSIFRLAGRRRYWRQMRYHSGFPPHYSGMSDGRDIISLRRNRDVADIAID